MTNFQSIYKLNKVLRCSSQYTDNLLESHIDIFDALNISNVSSELGLLLSMLMIKAGQMSTDEVNDERLIEKIKSYAEECKSLTLEKEKLVEVNSKTNRQVYRKRDKSQNKIEAPKSKVVRTNADAILDKINKEYTIDKRDMSLSPRF